MFELNRFWRRRSIYLVGATLIIGGFFILAGLGKIPSQTEAFIFIFGLPRSSLHPMLANYIDMCLPWAEIILGTLLILGIATKITATGTGLFAVAFMVNNCIAIINGLDKGDSCGCFGTIPVLNQITAVQATVIDAIILALVVAVLIWHPGGWLTLRPWYCRGVSNN